MNYKQTAVKMMDDIVPSIIMSEVAWKKMELYVDLVSTEIGWLGTIKKQEDDYYIEDVFLLEQMVHSANTTITADGLNNLIMELLNNGNSDAIDHLKFWGHSHVHMDVEPSAQDEETLEEMKSDNDPDFYLRGIFNKRRDIKFTLYDYSNRLVFDNLSYSIEEPEEDPFREQIQNEIDEKIFVQQFKPIHYNRRWAGFQSNVPKSYDDDNFDDYLNGFLGV
jgi:hypothetical protein